MKFQLGDCTAHLIANLFLGGFSGAVVSACAIVRNSLVFFKSGNKLVFSALIVTMMAVGMYCNNRGIVGVLPVVSSAMYSFVMCKSGSTAREIKMALVVNVLAWVIYDITVLSIPSFVSNVVVLISVVLNLLRGENSEAESETTPTEVV